MNELTIIDSIAEDAEPDTPRSQIVPGTIAWLIWAYVKDPISPFHDLRERTRVNDGGMLRRIVRTYGHVVLKDIKNRTLIEWHKIWSKDGACIPMGHAMMAKVRTVVRFGLLFLEDAECQRLRMVLHDMKFKQGPAREQFVTAPQADAIRAQAHKDGRPSIALAQAVQFEATLRQKDVIGEWSSHGEDGISDVVSERYGKWLRGIRWNEIDSNLILVHVTSKKEKKVTVDFKLAPMVIEEMRRQFPGCITKYQVRNKATGETRTELSVHRAALPSHGPLIIDEEHGRPYLTHKFRRLWRDMARAVGIPDAVQNRDTRAGAITEALACGASKDDVRQAATHSNEQMTSRYARDAPAAAERSMTARAANRVKTV